MLRYRHANHQEHAEHAAAPWWRTRNGLALCGLLLIAAFYLLTAHTAHVFEGLPYLLILLCPLMHLFMHHGHGSHREPARQPVRDVGAGVEPVEPPAGAS